MTCLNCGHSHRTVTLGCSASTVTPLSPSGVAVLAGWPRGGEGGSSSVRNPPLGHLTDPHGGGRHDR